MKHFIIVSILVIGATLLVYTGIQSIGVLPAQASAQAVSIDRLLNIQFWLISFLFSLITVTLLYSLVVFRRKPGDTSDGAHIEGNTRLEILWTLIPLFVVIFVAYLGAQSLGETRRVDPTALQVEVLSGQWFWSFTYPDYGVTTDTLYLPVNKQAVLRMTSIDVIHSFWVPEFRVKQDLVPGKTTELRITPIQTGEYQVLCAEICGASHAYMVAPVRVVTQEEFTAWIEQQASQVALDPVQRGRRLANQYCIACHSIDGSQKVGPTWKGLAGSVVQLADGSTVVADAEYLRNSIINPNLQIHAGFQPNVMPNFSNILSESQIEDLIAYIQSIK
ncbi:MAG: cytochrome c oxidase subunit II [Anaerolineales bacterium]|nr:cytochrome c oxidase subunit II [Anaerolineales bacterium]MCX7608783.1 cytochrome c oxidase subunit II [Anaerolineales bacterium]MDW8228002.1 cytochrome c oxidase subunit II [Anaerolineales bacterium]